MSRSLSKIAVLFLVLSMSLAMPMASFAAMLDSNGTISGITSDDPTDFLKSGGNDTFANVTDTVKQTASSVTTLITVIGLCGAVISFILGCMMIGMGDAQKRSQAKDKLVWVIIGSIGMGAAASFIGYLFTVGTKI